MFGTTLVPLAHKVRSTPCTFPENKVHNWPVIEAASSKVLICSLLYCLRTSKYPFSLKKVHIVLLRSNNEPEGDRNGLLKYF